MSEEQTSKYGLLSLFFGRRIKLCRRNTWKLTSVSKVTHPEKKLNIEIKAKSPTNKCPTNQHRNEDFFQCFGRRIKWCRWFWLQKGFGKRKNCESYSKTSQGFRRFLNFSSFLVMVQRLHISPAIARLFFNVRVNL